MDISTLTGTQGSAIGLIQGTGVSQTQSVNDVLTQDQDQDQDQAKVSQAGQNMSQLQQLASSDPDKFKAATQKISDDLAAASKNETDSKKSKFLENLSEKFAAASKSGSMSDLQLHGRDHAAMGKGAFAGKFAGQHESGMSGMFSEVGSIISTDLAGFTATGSSSATAASTTTTASASSEA